MGCLFFFHASFSLAQHSKVNHSRLSSFKVLEWRNIWVFVCVAWGEGARNSLRCQWASVDLHLSQGSSHHFQGFSLGLRPSTSTSRDTLLPSPAGPSLSIESLPLLFFQVSVISCFPSQVTGNPCSTTFTISIPVSTSRATTYYSLWQFRRISK